MRSPLCVAILVHLDIYCVVSVRGARREGVASIYRAYHSLATPNAEHGPLQSDAIRICFVL